MSIDGLVFASLQRLVSIALELPFFEEVVLATLSGLNADKAPGTDGFSLAFWHIAGIL